jgi:hypothetical protein
MAPGEADMVGSHTAGGETYKPLVAEAVTNLLGRHSHGLQPVGFADQAQQPMRICFVGVENNSIEEIGDFREQIYQMIDTLIVQSPVYQPISRRFVETGLRDLRMRPDDLLRPDAMRAFTATMEQMNQPFDYLLFAKISSGTTHSNADYQRDYMLTLEMIDVRNGHYDKETAHLSKRYNVSPMARIRNFGSAQ